MSIEDLRNDIADLQDDIAQHTVPDEICCMKLRLYDMEKILDMFDNQMNRERTEELQMDFRNKYNIKINIV